MNQVASTGDVGIHLIQVQAARTIQLERFSKIESSNIVANADMRVGEIRQFCKLQDEGQSLMRAAMTRLNLSARAYHRILKLACTIADLTGSEEIQSTTGRVPVVQIKAEDGIIELIKNKFSHLNNPSTTSSKVLSAA